MKCLFRFFFKTWNSFTCSLRNKNVGIAVYWLVFFTTMGGTNQKNDELFEIVSDNIESETYVRKYRYILFFNSDFFLNGNDYY